jgi:hypothetical protein
MSSANPSSQSRLWPRRVPVLLAWLIVSSFFAWTWRRSYGGADILAFFDRSGQVHGVMSYRGNLVVASTTLQLDPQRALSLKAMPVSMEDGDYLYTKIFTEAAAHQAWFQFGWSEMPSGKIASMPEASWWTASFPHWLPSAVCWLLTLRHIRRFTLRIPERKRRRRGQCIDCGYDLQGIEGDRCPECGRPMPITVATSKPAPASGLQPSLGAE